MNVLLLICIKLMTISCRKSSLDLCIYIYIYIIDDLELIDSEDLIYAVKIFSEPYSPVLNIKSKFYPDIEKRISKE